MKTLLSRIRNRRGQVAIFIALIFQVLFLFFAMIINVGLLVHHKINLQNSVDLAAYYGAMKQAEMMNAIGHVNYQIRQSWKLLSWRYRQLGTAGDYHIHPYNKLMKTIDTNKDREGVPAGLTATEHEYYDIPAFCITYAPFAPMPSSRESTCKDQSEQRTINLFSPPPVIAGFLGINNAIRNATIAALDAAIKRCEYVGQFNYVILAEFMAAFNIDQGQRKQLINYLSRGLSMKDNDFREINGDVASEGIIKTLKNNLTEANRNSIKDNQIKIINGLGLDACNSTGQPATDPAKWLSEVKIMPAFAYMDFKCTKTYNSNAVSKVEYKPKELNNDPANLPFYPNELRDDIAYLSQYTAPLQAPYNSSLGYEKNPWCMAYVGVSAETKPSIPFAPLGGVTLKARSFAKPFGGKIGPWYYGMWPRGSNQSSGGQRTDPLLPWRVGDKSNVADPKDPTRAANYSRFPGDKAGMKSPAVQGQFGRAIYNLSSEWSQLPPSTLDPDLPANWSKAVAPNFFHWNHLGRDFTAEKSGDILAWDNTQNAYPKMRDLELMAILPDLFDLTYYSIEPDFYHNYYLKLANEYVKKVPGFSYVIRPDLGVRMDSSDKNLSEFNIIKQYKRMDAVKTNDPQIHEPKVDFDTKLAYVAKDVYQVLTSWSGKDLKDYSLDPDKFGKCLTKDADRAKGGPTSGDCNNGGRTGYSVKIVSSEYLRAQDLELGGDGAGQGAILNPPDKDF